MAVGVRVGVGVGLGLRARVRVRFGAADLALAVGRVVEPVLGAALAALLPRDALVLRGVGAPRGSAARRPTFVRPHRRHPLPMTHRPPRALRQTAGLRLAVPG